MNIACKLFLGVGCSVILGISLMNYVPDSFIGPLLIIVAAGVLMYSRWILDGYE